MNCCVVVALLFRYLFFFFEKELFTKKKKVIIKSYTSFIDTKKELLFFEIFIKYLLKRKAIKSTICCSSDFNYDVNFFFLLFLNKNGRVAFNRI